MVKEVSINFVVLTEDFSTRHGASTPLTVPALGDRVGYSLPQASEKYRTFYDYKIYSLLIQPKNFNIGI